MTSEARTKTHSALGLPVPRPTKTAMLRRLQLSRRHLAAFSSLFDVSRSTALKMHNTFWNINIPSTYDVKQPNPTF